MPLKPLKKQKSSGDLLEEINGKPLQRSTTSKSFYFSRCKFSQDAEKNQGVTSPSTDMSRGWLKPLLRKMSLRDRDEKNKIGSEDGADDFEKEDIEGSGKNVENMQSDCYSPVFMPDDVINGAFKGSWSKRESICSETDMHAALTKRDFVVRELIDSERDYVRDLGLIVNGYLGCMRDPNCDIPMPEALQSGKDKIIFGNLEAIYEWHRDRFLVQLEGCREEPEKLGLVFKGSERKLHMYVLYCKNKPMSEFIVAEYINTYFEELRAKLGHRLQLSGLLIKPVQRIMKYGLLLKDISKYTERAGPSHQEELERLSEALQVMHDIPKAANDMMSVSRLRGFKGSITAQGKLLLHGPLLCIENQKQKSKQQHVLLFERCLIFSDVVSRRNARFSEPVYDYRIHIQVDKLGVEKNASCVINDIGFMVIASGQEPGKETQIACMAKSPEKAAEWVSKISEAIQAHNDLIAAMESPLDFHRERSRKSSAVPETE